MLKSANFTRLILLLPVFVFVPILTVFFAQDDFFHFQVARTDGSVGEFLKLFGFYSFNERGIAFYRPLSREVLYNLYYSVFGLNHIPFRLLELGLHALNIFLVYKIAQKIFDKEIARFTAFFFGLSSANVSTLYYLAGGIHAQIALVFVLSSLLLMDSYLNKKKPKAFLLSFILFVLALGSFEFAIVTIPLLAGLIVIRTLKAKKIARTARYTIYLLIPFVLITALYLFLEISIIGFSKEEVQYQPIFSIGKALNTFGWYTGWGLGLPEMLIDFVNPGFGLNPSLMLYWGNYFKIIFPTFFVSFGLLGLLTMMLAIKSIKTLLQGKLLYVLLWFSVGLVPVLFLPLHKSTHYEYLSLPGLWAAVGYIVVTSWRKLPKTRILLGILTICLIGLSITSIRLGHDTYWAAQRGRVAKKLIDFVKYEHPTVPLGATFYVRNDPAYPFVATDWGGTSKQAAFALSQDDAFQLLYGDWTIHVFFEDLGGIPLEFEDNSIITIMAKDEFIRLQK